MRKNIKAFIGFGLMWQEEKYLEHILNKLESIYGSNYHITDPFYINYSKYYHKEMGEDLKKVFTVFEFMIDKSELLNIKKFFMKVEDDFRVEGKRKVNIDPYYIDTDQVVVSTSKYRGNRIYLGGGIFAELELFYHHGSFQPMIWTYLDYKEYIPFFNKIRYIYKKHS
ncbi:DUF4416 family protein [Persephonella sp.]